MDPPGNHSHTAKQEVTPAGDPQVEVIPSSLQRRSATDMIHNTQPTQPTHRLQSLRFNNTAPDGNATEQLVGEMEARLEKTTHKWQDPTAFQKLNMAMRHLDNTSPSHKMVKLRVQMFLCREAQITAEALRRTSALHKRLQASLKTLQESGGLTTVGYLSKVVSSLLEHFKVSRSALSSSSGSMGASGSKSTGSSSLILGGGTSSGSNSASQSSGTAVPIEEMGSNELLDTLRNIVENEVENEDLLEWLMDRVHCLLKLADLEFPPMPDEGTTSGAAATPTAG